MALFQKVVSYRPVHHAPVPRAYKPQPQLVPRTPIKTFLPDTWKSLTTLCSRNHLPTPMQFTGWARTASGHPVAEFKCGLCQAVNGFGMDFNTAQPKYLYSK